MYQEHSSFSPPCDDAVLWRYMDFIKFVSILEEQALFFTRADKLGDPFEGSSPHHNRETTRRYFEGLSNPYRDILQQASLRDTVESPRFMLVSCWHKNDHESAAMWKLYSKDDNGIAIKTNFDSFKKSFTTSEEIFIGKINYLDYETDSFSYNSWSAPFLSKRKIYEHEREVRAIIQIPPTEDGQAGDGKRIVYPQDICDVGNHYKVDLSRLIKEVIVSPYAPNWHLELIKLVAARYELAAPVVRSAFAENPTWD